MVRGRSDDKRGGAGRRDGGRSKRGGDPARQTSARASARQAKRRTEALGEDLPDWTPINPADPTSLGGPPSRPPARRPLSDPSAGTAVPGGLADRPSGVGPPVRRTTDLPRIPADGVAPLDGPAAGDLAQPDASAGVFGQSRSDAGEPANRSRSGSRRAKPIPSALPEFDEQIPSADGEVAADPASAVGDPELVGSGLHADDQQFAPVGAAAMSGGGAYEGFDGGAPGAAAGYAPPADPARPMNAGGHVAEPGTGGTGGVGYGAPGPQGPRQAGPRPGVPGPDGHSSGADGRPRGGARRERAQDTEFKFADNRPRQRPKEPNRFLLALGLGAVLLLGAAAAWYFTRDSGDTDVAADEAGQVVTDTTVTTEPATPEATVAPEPLVNEPTLFFEAATSGPLREGETYSIDLVGEPEGSLLQVVVDDIRQGEPDVLLPDLILPAGRHRIFIEMTNGTEVSQSTAVDLFVLGPPSPQGFAANLSSVDMQTEGWAEAIRRFDEYRAAGHESVQIRPISPGYYNIFVAGFGEDRSAAVAYCESFNLAVPDQCFPTYHESTASDTASTTESTDAMTDEDPDAMADEDATSTTAAGG